MSPRPADEVSTEQGSRGEGRDRATQSPLRASGEEKVGDDEWVAGNGVGSPALCLNLPEGSRRSGIEVLQLCRPFLLSVAARDDGREASRRAWGRGGVHDQRDANSRARSGHYVMHAKTKSDAPGINSTPAVGGDRWTTLNREEVQGQRKKRRTPSNMTGEKRRGLQSP